MEIRKKLKTQNEEINNLASGQIYRGESLAFMNIQVELIMIKFNRLLSFILQKTTYNKI